MAVVRALRRAWGAPGIAPRWTQSAKDAIGTAYSAGSTVWFTVSAGILNEAYYPTIDRPQIRDLQFLVTDGERFFHDGGRHPDSRLGPLSKDGPRGGVTNSHPEGRRPVRREGMAAPPP